MMIRRLLIFFIFSILFLPLFFPASVLAVKYTLTAPSGVLNRGDNVQFTVNIDAQGATLTSGSTEISYKTQFLQYVSTTNGNFFSSATGTDTGNTVKLTGSTSTGKTGTGTFAVITFKLIASAPGETELCSIITPSPTQVPSGQPTSTPTSIPVATSTPKPTSTPVPTNTPRPTISQLPRSGSTEVTFFLSLLGISVSSVGVALHKLRS